MNKQLHVTSTAHKARLSVIKWLLSWTMLAAWPWLFATGADAQQGLANIPPPGRMVAVDGHQLHLYCTGAGTPTVILEVGAGGGALYWIWVQRAVAKTTRVCSYDRPGIGWSDPVDGPKDASSVSQRLSALLNSAGEAGPYVLVGQSLGGAYMRKFAAEHRGELAGIVLVDASNPSVLTTTEEVGLPAFEKSSFTGFLASNDALWGFASGLGVIRGTYDIQLNDFPSDLTSVMQAFVEDPQRVRAAVAEQSGVYDTLREIEALENLGNLPVTVISSDRWIDKDAAMAAKRAEWNKQQQRNWLSVSTNSLFLIVPGSDHLSLLSNRNHAGQVAEAVLNLVRRVKKPGRK
jgi:pimeloyl-ACP methyl ester carboxylesterase